MKREVWRPVSLILASAAIMIGAAMLLTVLIAGQPQADHLLGTASPNPWMVHLKELDEAVAKRRAGSAELAWHHAYIAALEGSGWEGLLEVGHAALRIPEITSSRKAAEEKARRAYAAARAHAQQRASLPGLLRIAEAFAALRDREAVEECLCVAKRLAVAAGDVQALERASALEAALAARFRSPPSVDEDRCFSVPPYRGGYD